MVGHEKKNYVEKQLEKWHNKIARHTQNNCIKTAVRPVEINYRKYSKCSLNLHRFANSYCGHVVYFIRALYNSQHRNDLSEEGKSFSQT